jgi:hypothetical protein
MSTLRFRKRTRAALIAVVLLSLYGARAECAAAKPSEAVTYDIVFENVRAIDPETNLDAVRNIGIIGDTIRAVSVEPLQGRKTIDGRGLVAAPGFVDPHSHAYGYETATYQAMDGVTTRLELELGVYPVRAWYERKAGHELINYGASLSHDRIRYSLQLGGTLSDPKIDGFAQSDLPNTPEFDRLIHQPIPAEAYPRFVPTLEAGLRDGAIGIGSGTQYAPGITRPEMLDLTRVAAEHHMCVFTHFRYGSLVEPGSTFEAIQEQIANAAITGACVHMAHINSMAMSATLEMLEVIHGARDHGVDVSTEMYPWDASSDHIRSLMFDPGWEQRWGVTPADLQSTATGKRLTRQEFDALRSGTGPDGVLMHMNTEETLSRALQDPLVMVISDSSDIKDRYSHPRSAGTHARLLGHYVRETGVLTLPDAIRKMTLMPAQRLETFVASMRRKGRLQVGCDADLVVFDPATVGARATYMDAKEYSQGFEYVLVNGQFVVKKGAIVKDVFPGRPVYSDYKQQKP